MPGEKRKVPLEPYKASPAEWAALGLPSQELVISPVPAKPSERKEPLKARNVEPEEWEALGLPLRSLVVSPASAKPSKKSPKNANKTPKPNSKNA